MPIKMNKPGESSFGINIDDSFDPTDDHRVQLVDMDEYEGISTIDGKPYTSIKWILRVFDADGNSFTNLIDGSPYETWQFTSKSMAPKSNARAWAAAFLGKQELTDMECDRLAENFDGALMEKFALASWKVEDKDGNKRLKIALLRPLKKTAAARTTPAAVPVQESAPKTAAETNGRTSHRETAAERRAKLEAELAGLTDEDVDGEPFDDSND